MLLSEVFGAAAALVWLLSKWHRPIGLLACTQIPLVVLGLLPGAVLRRGIWVHCFTALNSHSFARACASRVLRCCAGLATRGPVCCLWVGTGEVDNVPTMTSLQYICMKQHAQALARGQKQACNVHDQQ